MTDCALVRPHPETADEHRTRTWVGVAVVVAACVGVEVVSAAVTAAAVRGDWYATLPKPAWLPPEHVLGPVRALVGLMAAAAGVLVWLARDREDVCCPLVGFGLQLAAGLAWTVLFFGLHRPFLAFLDALVLWVVSGLTAVHFFEASRPAGWLMVPGWLGATAAAAGTAAVLAHAG